MYQDDLFNYLPHVIFHSLKQKMLLGELSAETVDDLLSPLLINYKQIMPDLSLSLQYDIRKILINYPELKEKYKITTLTCCSLKYLIFFYWNFFTTINNYSIIFKKFTTKKFRPNVNQLFIVPVNQIQKRLAYASVLITSFILFIYFYPSGMYSSRDMILFLQDQSSSYINILKARPVEDNMIHLLNYQPFVTNESIAFKTGYSISYLYLSLNQKHKDNITFWIRRVKKNTSAFHVKTFIEIFEKREDHHSYMQLVDQLEKLFSQKKVMDIYRLGEWCAIAQAVTSSENILLIKDFFENKKTIKKLINNISKRKKYPFDIAVNILNSIDTMDLDYGNTEEITLIKQEIQKIINSLSIQ